MATDSFKVKNSLNIGPKSTAGSEAGDLRVDSTDSNKLKYHNGTSEDALSMAADLTTHESDTSTHGVTGDIVGTTDSQALSNKTVGLQDGSAAAPSLHFTDDTNTGLYSSAADTAEIVAGGQLAIQTKKASGSFGNVGLGSSASTSDQFPLLIERNHTDNTIVQVSNPNGAAAAVPKVQLKSDTGAISGAEMALHPSAQTAIHAYTDRLAIRGFGTAKGVSLIAGDEPTGDVRMYAGGYASTNEVARFNADLSTELNGDLTVDGTSVSLGTTNTATTVNIGTGTGVNTVNIGGANTTINMTGSVNNQNVTNLDVDDKLITINKGGAASSGAVAGIDVEEDGSSTGYVKTSADRNSWEIKAPNTAGVASLTPGSSNDTVALVAATQTLTNKTLTSPTLTSPVLDTGVSGTAVKDEDDMVSDSATHLATQQSIKAYVDNAVGALTPAPTGSVIMYGGATAPTGWLLLDGSAVSRATYADLYTVLGDTYGAGDGSTTFNLPDARGVFVRGAGSQTISGTTYTGTRGTTERDQLQGHTHNIRINGAPVYQGSTSGSGANNQDNNGGGNNGQLWYNEGPSDDSTNGTPRVGAETRPANIVLSYIIKT